MTYTLWHRGVLIGETDFEGSENAPRNDGRLHLAGIFRPTPHGRSLLPRLCGFFTAASELKNELVRRGVDTEDPEPELMRHLFETTSAGLHIIDIGRVLCDVELRAPDGARVTVASMGFMDVAELASLSRKLGCADTAELRALPPDAPEFLVSVTLPELTGQLQ